MFDIGEYVVFGTDGVCTVEAVGCLDIEGVSKEKVYYTLAPVGKKGSNRIFAPVDSKRVVMRRVITLDEAKALIGKINEIKPLDVSDEKKREEAYKAALTSCDCVQIISLIKEIYRRKKARYAAGKKLPAVDERYCSMAENSLYSELSLPLNMEKDRVEEYIADAVGAEAAK